MEFSEILKSDGLPLDICPGKAIIRIAYHEKLNVIFVGTADREIYVIDPTLGDVLYSTKIGVSVDGLNVQDESQLQWDFNVGPDKFVVVDRNIVGIRSEYNGILLVGSILQIPISASSEQVQIELNKAEAESLCHSFSAVDAATEPDSGDVEKQLKQVVNKDAEGGIPLISVKKEKWSTVKLELPHSVLKSTFQSMVNELWKKNAYIPQLSIASSILERLNMLHPPGKVDSDLPLDKTQMFSESARLNTFTNWPHMDYKWALPEKMAQAGFYHNPSTNGDDRAMCFTCNVCLVSWEPTDEPWSEHERHSPFCPFVRGEHTHNVPLCLSYATAPAFTIKQAQNMGTPILGKSSCSNAAVVGFAMGLVVVWDIAKQVNEAVEFELTPKDLISSEPVINSSYCDVDLKPKEAWVMDTSENTKDISSPDHLTIVNSEEKVTLTSVAVVGAPTTAGETEKCCPPSVLVGGTFVKACNLKIEFQTFSSHPFVLVYGLSSTAISTEESSTVSDEVFKAVGSTGTKQESQNYEDDIFGSYISEGDLMSDSVSIFSDMNMSDSSSTFVLDPVNISNSVPIMPTMKKKAAIATKKVDTPSKSKTFVTKSAPKVVIVQKLNFPSDLQHCTVVRDLFPSCDGSQVIALLEGGIELTDHPSNVYGAILTYNVVIENNIVLLARQPLAVLKIENAADLPSTSCLIPPEIGESTFACVLRSGDVHIFSLNELSLLHKIKRPSTDLRVTSVSYCGSLERLCCGTNLGTVELYALGNQSESDYLDDKSVEYSPSSKNEKQKSPVTDYSKLIVNQPINLSSMKQLLQLTAFENVKPCFSANVPSCWVKIIQAQKERKHPQHLQHHDSEISVTTLSWRLQRNKNSKKEHLFEITLPKSTAVGHLDLKFLLQMGCVTLPTIEVTLYRAMKSKSRNGSADVDRAIDFGSQLKMKTPSNEFLKSINAEIVCGPLDLGSHIDLSAQGGNVVMTSPSLMLTKGRNFYLHIKAKTTGKNEAAGSPTLKSPKVKTEPPMKPKSSSSAFTKPTIKPPVKTQGSKDESSIYDIVCSHFYPSHHKILENSQGEAEKRKDYGGCDWLHEVSITIRQIKYTVVPNEDYERRAMLTSSNFMERLLSTAIFEGEEITYAAQNAALDLLVWIAAVNLCGPQVGSSNYQLTFIRAVQTKLSALILHGILFADRSTAHKCAKLLVLCIDAVETYHSKENGEPFLLSVMNSLLSMLPFTISCTSAGSLQWYFLLLNRVRNENLSLSSESVLNLLKEVSNELNKRTDPMHALLRTRFGLYGTPFEPELFEIELPPVTKSYSHPLTYAGMCGGDNPNATVGSGTFHLWGLKDVDFRDLLVGNPLNLRFGKIGTLSPKQQIQGLLEVEPLHFTCHAASDGTRIEKIDLGVTPSSFSAVPLPQPWEPFTNMPTGEGSKKSEPDKVEQIMMLQKALKMENNDAYYDVLSDLKFMESNVNVIELPYPNPTEAALAHISQMPMDPNNWKNHVGVLTMVMQPPGQPNPAPGPSKLLYGPFIQPSMGQLPLPFGSGSKCPHQAVSSQPSAASAAAETNTASKSSLSMNHDTLKTGENDGLRLLLSPWQQMMYVPPQQALVIDRMHSGARRFVVLDFGTPILLTDMVIPSCNDLVSLSIDIWIHREETDGQRLVVASDIGMRSLVICDLQPPPICRYLKITTIGRYGMGTTKCRIPVGMFYGHTAVLPNDLRMVGSAIPSDVTVLSPTNVQAHLSVLSYLVEDIGCRYQLACAKLRRLLEPLLKPELSSLDHISYYLPKGKERNKLGLNSPSDQSIICSYQECITLQQQLNVAKNVVKRLQKSLSPFPSRNLSNSPSLLLAEICTDKVHLLSEFLIESLLGISFLASNTTIHNPVPYSLYTNMNQKMCEGLFRDICVLENGQCQLSTCTLMLRVCGFQFWWGKFLASTLKNLFSSMNSSLFPQDRVFILLVYLGQKALLSGQNSSVLESSMDLLAELLSPIEDKSGFLRSKVDMTLLGWVVMYLCLCLDGVNCTLASNTIDNNSNIASGASNGNRKSKEKDSKDVSCLSSRWDFIQGESALYRRISGPSKVVGSGGFKRRIQKKIMATKQKLEELDSVAAGLGYANQLQAVGGLGTQLSALGNKIEAIKQKQANIGKSIKLQSSKHFKDLLQIRRTEMLYKRGLLCGKEGKEDCAPNTDIEINLNLNPTLCLTVAKRLGLLLLRMDSTCHSDVYLIVCKALARIATACRPAIPIGSIFTCDQLISLILTAVGSDYVRQRNWSSSWISHAIMCLVQDILEGERLFPPKSDEGLNEASSLSEDIMSGVEESSSNVVAEEMSVDDVDAVNEMLGAMAGSTPMESNMSLDSEDSDYDEVIGDFAFNPTENRHNCNSSKKGTSAKKLTPCVTSISTALDARLESGVESTTELRLRIMAVVDSEVLTQSLKAPIEIPNEILKNVGSTKPPAMTETLPQTSVNSCQLLASCFDRIFQMMSSENCSVSIEKVLQLWISINMDIPGTEDIHTIKPAVPLSCGSISALMMAFTKNTGIGVQEWGLAFQCLSLAANQRALNSTNGQWLYIMSDKYFPKMILKFISGSGMNLQKSHIVSAGPTVCQHFYNFLLRIRHLSNDTPWTPCLKEVLLRVLSVFLSGPFLNSDFPLDAFNKFLDRVTCPDLSYENPSTVISIIEQFAQILHLFVFFPNKITIRSTGDVKTIPTTSTAVSASTTETKAGKTQNFEYVMFRLVSFMASFVSLPYKLTSTPDNEVQEFLAQMPISSQLKDYDQVLTEYVQKCGDTPPKNIADIVLQMEPTMMRILSVLANPNGINVLVSGDLLSAFNIMETSTPTTVVDSVIHLFSKLCNSASQPLWTIQPLFKFLSKSPYDDFYCPLIVSETFVLMVLKVISKEEHLKEFTKLKCVESVCDKLVSSTRKFFSSCPTFVSILTQYIGRTETNAMFGQKKFGNEPIELQDGLINVAPLGTITSTNFSAHPSEVLLQATPPHRRARTPVWSYHFFPEESFLELVITLPCAILLKEVQIVPHMTSLSTACPSAVMVEVSRDRSNLTLPMGPPVHCGGLSTINIQLTQPEVAQTVLLRLFKPKDSNNLGLSQIRLLGCTTFSEAALQGLSATESVKSLESSAHWMYILDRAISVSEGNIELHHHIIETSVNIPDMLESCYSMLVAPVASGKAQEVYLPHVASVLFQFGSHRKDVSEQLMTALLGPVQMGFSHGMVANANPQSVGGLSQLNTVVELVFKLCCNIPQWGYSNLVTVINWLESCADQSVASPSSGSIIGIVPEYVQSVAAALWSVAATGKTDLSEIATSQLLKKLYDWSLILEPKSELKCTLDHMICSVCFSKPWLFVYLMHCMEIIKPMDWTEKDKPIEELLQMWYEEGSTWDRVHVKDLQSLKGLLNAGVLMTLGRSAQSQTSSNMLQYSQLLVYLNSSIMEFWSHFTSKWVSGNVGCSHETPSNIISTQSLVGILSFYTELCRVNEFKNWFGSNGSGFWLPILNLLSTLPGSLKSAFFVSSVYDLESVVIGFLARCCWSHPENQKIIAACLREIILKQKTTPHKAVFLHSMSSFCRRLLIQLLLENEKVIVHVKSSSKYPLKTPMSSLPLKDKHPSMGVNGGDRIFYMSTHSYAYELMKFIEPFGVTLEKISSTSTDPNRFMSMLKREQGLIEAGLEMIDQMQLAMSGNAAKDKRALTDVKRPIKTASKKLKPDGVIETKSANGETDKTKGPTLVLEPEEFPDVKVPPNVPLATLMSAVRHQKPDAFLDILVFIMRTEVTCASSSNVSPSASSSNFSNADSDTPTLSALREGKRKDSIPEVFDISPLPSTIEVFSRLGGLGLLAKHLPVVYPETLRQIAVGSKFTGTVGVVMNFEKDSPVMVADNDWVKIESADDFYDDMMESMVATSTPIPKRVTAAMRQFNPTPGIPPHSMAAFGLFLSLPRFSEVLLSERIGAQCMLRLVMGVTDDADGNDIFNSAVAKTLPTLPFQVLRCLLDALSLNSDEGKKLRRAMVDVKATHFILACLAVFTHQACDPSLIPGLQHELVIAATKAQGGYHEKGGKSDDKSHVYWAKGTGFGTGSTAQSWDVELAMQKKKAEEENVTCLLHVLSSFINPRASRAREEEKDLSESGSETHIKVQETEPDNLPPEMLDLLKHSCLFPAIAGYLRNDSVLDMARHVPLYKSVLQFLRSLVSSPQLLPLLAPLEKRTISGVEEQPISCLLSKMKEVVDNYAKRLITNSKGKAGKNKSACKPFEDLEDEGLALLIPDIQSTAILVEKAVTELILKQGPPDFEMGDESSLCLVPVRKTLEERYLDEIKKLQFAFFEMITEEEDGSGIRFTVPYHYEGNVRTNWSRSFPTRLKRLAQESVTLSTSLPIAYGSTIFVRCDNDRLDVMKVLITGPSCTPYSNGCFEFDIFFPNDYPNSPMMINLETTGRQRVRFNPNLYTDGKVCLSILNTWHGRPEEKWNPQTSSLLPVLVAIQSLILNAEPYFNEPGYEKSRGTDAGERNSREYNAGIEIATVEWAMLDQIRHPSPCFKEIIHRHFWMKRAEVVTQCEKWLEELIVTCRNDKRAGKNVTGSADPVTVFKNNLALLKKEFISMKPPEGLEDLLDLYPTKEEGAHTASTSSENPPVPLDPIEVAKAKARLIADPRNSSSLLPAHEGLDDEDEDDDDDDDDDKMLVDM